MGMTEKIIGKAMQSTIPKLTEVLESLHGFTRLNCRINQQILIELMRKRNPQWTEQEAKEQTDELINDYQKSIADDTSSI